MTPITMRPNVTTFTNLQADSLLKSNPNVQFPEDVILNAPLSPIAGVRRISPSGARTRFWQYYTVPDGSQAACLDIAGRDVTLERIELWNPEVTDQTTDRKVFEKYPGTKFGLPPDTQWRAVPQAESRRDVSPPPPCSPKLAARPEKPLAGHRPLTACR